MLGAAFLGNALLAELIGGKLFQVPTRWHTFTLSAGIVLWPVVFIMTDIVNEYFGRQGVRKLSFLAAGIISYAYLALFLTRLAHFAHGDPAEYAKLRATLVADGLLRDDAGVLRLARVI